jgi:hypothetical protein
MRCYIFAHTATPGTAHLWSGDSVGGVGGGQVTVSVPTPGANQPTVGTAYKISPSDQMEARYGVSAVTCITAAPPNYTFQ